MNAQETARTTGRYGPLGFAAALVNILIIEFITWVLLPWVSLLIFLIPFLLLDLGLSAFLKSRQGKLSEIGWGMMVGCISAPVAAVFFVSLYFLVCAVGII